MPKLLKSQGPAATAYLDRKYPGRSTYPSAATIAIIEAADRREAAAADGPLTSRRGDESAERRRADRSRPDPYRHERMDAIKVDYWKLMAGMLRSAVPARSRRAKEFQFMEWWSERDPQLCLHGLEREHDLLQIEEDILMTIGQDLACGRFGLFLDPRVLIGRQDRLEYAIEFFPERISVDERRLLSWLGYHVGLSLVIDDETPRIPGRMRVLLYRENTPLDREDDFDALMAACGLDG